jgi:hypothetical protein
MPSQSFSEAISGLPSAKQFSDFLPFLDRLPSKGYTGIWVENDIITPGPESHHPDIEQDYQILFRGNFKLHNIFDYTFRPDNEVYVTHLAQLMAACAERGLAVYLSFWIPKLSKAFYEFLLTEHPSAIGSSTTFHYKRTPTLSTCEGSGGLELLEAIVANLMERFPGIAGLKVACEDNAAWICDEESPFANGTTRARHTANMYRAVLSGIRRHSPDAKLLIYPWIWAEGAGEEVYKLLKDDYFIMSKLESGSHQDLGPGMPTHPIMDASIVSERPGDIFSFWKERVGTSRIFDMVPVGAGIDDFFLNYPPYPGRVFRRLKFLKEQGVRGFLDFECGGHHEGSCEEAVALFQQTSEADQEQFLNRLAAGMTGNEAAARLAVAGWNAFDKGFGFIPMGLGDTGEFTNLFSERLGFAWSMCIATPLLPGPFLAEDKLHHVHFFSPYALFHGRTVQRLELFFQQVWRHWAEATAALKAAAALDPENQALRREAIAARAHFLSMSSVLHWCLAARLSESGDHAAFGRLQIEEVELTKSFQALITSNPWVWDNNCWQPHRTPMSQRNLHPLLGANANLEADTFQTKLAIMRAWLDSKVFLGGGESHEGFE